MVVILETIGLTRHFGRVTAADDVSVQIEAGERIGIVGPNGAGKTTFLNLITGHVQAQRGQILFRGRDITGFAPAAVTALGIARSFQVPQLFTSLTVLENLMLAEAAQGDGRLDVWQSLQRETWIAEGTDILDQFGLGGQVQQPVNELPEGALKLLDVALSVALQPELLFMDEPTSGVSSEAKFDVMDTLAKVLEQMGVTTVFVEHDFEVVRRYAKRVLVFNRGRVVADGDPRALLADAESYRRLLKDE